MEELSGLSNKGSYSIVNFMSMNPGCKPDNMDDILIAQGWTKEKTLMFGQEDFNYGWYPEGKSAN